MKENTELGDLSPSILGVIGFRAPCMNPSILGVIGFRVSLYES